MHKKPTDQKAKMDTVKKGETKESWVTPDKFEMDCADLDRETGVRTPERIQKRIEEFEAEKAKSAKD